MTAHWAPLHAELAVWRREGLALPLWWRDDDATDPTPALDRLLGLQDKLALPVHLAIIPQPATKALADHLHGRKAVPMIHGWAHANHAPGGAKKAEFNHPRPALTDDTERAITRMAQLFGARLLRVFVPPWNRIHPDAVAALSAQGYRGLSTFTPRTARQVAGLVQINTHIDPIHWKAGGGLHDPDLLIAQMTAQLQGRRQGRWDAAEPLGFLSHHLVHDADIWRFTEHCLSALLDGGARPVDLHKQADLP